MSESKITDAAKDIAGKAFEKLQDSAAPLNNALINRFGSPVFYSFLVSWALLNWERIAIIAAGTGVLEKRIAVAKELPSIFFGVEHATTYYIPFLSTLIIVFVSPYINLIIDKFHTVAFRHKYIHTARLDAQKYNADTRALSSKIAYEMAGAKERLRIEADNIQNQSRIEIANLNLETAKSELNSLIETTGAQKNVYLENAKLLDNITASINSESDKLASIRADLISSNDTLAGLNKLIIQKQNFLDDLTKKGRAFSKLDEAGKIVSSIVDTPS